MKLRFLRFAFNLSERKEGNSTRHWRCPNVIPVEGLVVLLPLSLTMPETPTPQPDIVMSLVRHGITSIVSVVVVHLSLYFHSMYVELIVTFAVNLLIVIAMALWSRADKNEKIHALRMTATRLIRAALILQSGASIEDAMHIVACEQGVTVKETATLVKELIVTQPPGENKL